MITATAKNALETMRTIQKQGGLTIGGLRRMDTLIETIRTEAKAQGITTYRMVQLIEGNNAGWRKEWS